MARFVLEIGTEEMPARFLPGLRKDLKRELHAKLERAQLNFSRIDTWTTPRRIVGAVEEIAEAQKREEKLFTGPPAGISFDQEGNPSKAALGFARSHGAEVEDLFVRDTEKGKYLAVRKSVGGRFAEELLPEICPACLNGLFFPKKMRWADRFTFGRPIRWMVALLDDRIIPFTVSDVQSGRSTYGHRVQGPGPFEIRAASELESVLSQSGGVVLGEDERREIIQEGGENKALEVGGRVIWKEGLLLETANLVEHPRPLLGGFLSDYLELPEEVLLTSMEKHQKSFGVRDDSGKLMPYFLTVVNLEPEDEYLVQRGWERVLKARLEDARFFWEADTRTPLENFVSRLDRVVFMSGLGSMGEKAERLASLGAELARETGVADPEHMDRAGKLAKSDLVSEMVGEFDSLQGIMGGIYAARQGEDKVVCEAVSDHYLPEGPDSPVPKTAAGALLSLVDKLDNLVGCFGLNMVPKGTADPYALRRQANAVLRIIMEYEFEFDLDELCLQVYEKYTGVQWALPQEKLRQALMQFFAHRLRAMWEEEFSDTRVVDAVIKAGFTHPSSARKRIEALDSFTSREGYAYDVLTFKRADNIIRKQADTRLDGDYERAFFESSQETALADKIEEILPQWDTMCRDGRFSELLELLKVLRPYVDDLFDHVMVMTEDQKLRVNRFNLLYALTSRLSQLADFSALQV